MGGSPTGFGIARVTLQNDGVTSQFQTVTCIECGDKLMFRVTKTHLPNVAIYNMARRKGWRVDPKRETIICPKHLKTEKTPVTKKPSPAETPPRQMTREHRREIWREIDGSYEEANHRYVPGISDQTIAEKLKVPRAWVTEVRDSDFGPPGPPPEFAEIEKALTALRDRADQIETKAVEALSQAETGANVIRHEISKIEARLKALAS